MAYQDPEERPATSPTHESLLAQSAAAGGFASGTLVHTEQGLMPIEQVQVGMQVLSQAEPGGARKLQPVRSTSHQPQQPVWVIRVRVVGEEFPTTLLATPEQRFGVQAVKQDGDSVFIWPTAEQLAPGWRVHLAEGDPAYIHLAAVLRQTQHVGCAFALDKRAVLGMPGVAMDARGEHIVLLHNPLSAQMHDECEHGRLQLGAPWLTTIHSLSVEHSHSYFVGDTGVWVQDQSLDNKP